MKIQKRLIVVLVHGFDHCLGTVSQRDLWSRELGTWMEQKDLMMKMRNMHLGLIDRIVGINF